MTLRRRCGPGAPGRVAPRERSACCYWLMSVSVSIDGRGPGHADPWSLSARRGKAPISGSRGERFAHTRFFAGFHRCLPALAAAGNDLIVEHIIEFRAWRSDLARSRRP
jgi:hypothetical protein